MEEFFRYLLDPHLFPPEFVLVLDYVRYFVIAISGAMLISIIYFIIDTQLLEEKYLKDILEFTKAAPYKEIKMPKNWSTLRTQSENEDSSERKLAIIEADDMLTDILKEMGYDGISLEETLEEVSKEVVPNKEDLIEAHRTRQELIYNPNLDLSQDDAREIMNTYEETLKDLQLF